MRDEIKAPGTAIASGPPKAPGTPRASGLSSILRLLRLGHHGRIATPYVALDRSLCKACWRCQAVCPESVIGKVEFGSHKHAVIDAADRCTGCESCVEVCRSGALSARRGDA